MLLAEHLKNVRPFKFKLNLQIRCKQKSTIRVDNAHLVEHLEKSSPLIIDEIAQWKGLIWEDYLDYQQEQKRRRS